MDSDYSRKVMKVNRMGFQNFTQIAIPRRAGNLSSKFVYASNYLSALSRQLQLFFDSKRFGAKVETYII